MQKKNNWFETWFDTEYYHILYKNRNDKEAHFFMDNLVNYLEIANNSTVLDLACGKGRHSIYLNKKELDVVGVDLSEQSIKYAQQFKNETLHFDVHDMREVYTKQKFNYIFNLFTSFGYFEDDSENQKAISAMEQMLDTNGVLVIDFLNATKVIKNLIKEEQKIIDGITFNIKRKVENQFIVKTISFEDKGKKYSFEERVKALRLEDFEKFINHTNMELFEVFGNFALDKFDENTSDRLIMILRMPLLCM